MCDINNRQLDAAIAQMAFNLIGKAIDASIAQTRGINQPTNQSLLGAAIQAYEQKKITKSQLLQIIEMIDSTNVISSLDRMFNY